MAARCHDQKEEKGVVGEMKRVRERENAYSIGGDFKNRE